jgi:hypothetical protein
VVPAN